MALLSRLSPAKINLTLRVSGVRGDGFHELESLVAQITLYDTIAVTPRAGRRVLSCDDPRVPDDERNLALRAASELSAEAGIEDGFELRIQKRIPLGAGLGGGSSNAATTLLLLNELWGLGLTRERLARIGARVGSDVPLFLHGPVSIIRGRGEQVQPVELPVPGHLLLLMPDVHSATAEVYRAWDGLPVHPQRPGLDSVLSKVKRPLEFSQVLFNDLEEAALKVNPELARIAADLRRLLPYPVHMTGSGATFFCLMESPQAALEAESAVGKAGLGVRAEQAAFAATEV